jgi:hypothetical protein
MQKKNGKEKRKKDQKESPTGLSMLSTVARNCVELVAAAPLSWWDKEGGGRGPPSICNKEPYCPHTAGYVSSCCYMCVLMLL